MLSKPNNDKIIKSSIFIEYVIHKCSNLEPNDKYDRWIEAFNNLVDRVLKDSDETLHNKIEDIIRNLFTTGFNISIFGTVEISLLFRTSKLSFIWVIISFIRILICC